MVRGRRRGCAAVVDHIDRRVPYSLACGAHSVLRHPGAAPQTLDPYGRSTGTGGAVDARCRRHAVGARAAGGAHRRPELLSQAPRYSALDVAVPRNRSRQVGAHRLSDLMYGHARRLVGACPAPGSSLAGSAVGHTGVAGLASTNPHNQIFAIAIQLGLVGTLVLFVMWVAHLRLFCGPGLAAGIGLAVVVQNIVSSFFNSSLFDFTHGWLYVWGVGVLGGMMLHQSPDAGARFDASAKAMVSRLKMSFARAGSLFRRLGN